MKLVIGLIMMAIQWCLVYHITIHRPVWMRTWNIFSTSAVVFSLPWFLIALYLVFPTK